MRAERSKQFTDIRSKIEKINAEIAGRSHGQDTSPRPHGLTIRRLNEYRARLSNLQKEKVSSTYQSGSYCSPVPDADLEEDEYVAALEDPEVEEEEDATPLDASIMAWRRGEGASRRSWTEKPTRGAEKELAGGAEKELVGGPTGGEGAGWRRGEGAGRRSGEGAG